MSTLIGEEVGVLALSCLPTYEEAILTSLRAWKKSPGSTQKGPEPHLTGQAQGVTLQLLLSYLDLCSSWTEDWTSTCGGGPRPH